MISIHANARFFPGAPVLSQVMPLPDAIQILHDDAGEAANSRRRRAVAKLAAYWFTRNIPFQQQVVAIAGQTALQKIADTLVELGGTPLPPAILELKFQHALNVLTPGCPWEPLTLPSSEIRDNPPPIEWSFNVLVPREKTDIARSLDPQSWNECSPLFWASYLVSTPSCCGSNVYPRDCTCATNSSTNADDAGDPLPSTPKPRGMPYGWNTFYENVCTDAQPPSQSECQRCGGTYNPGTSSATNVDCDTCFENLLCVMTQYDVSISSSDQLGQVNQYDVHYNFGKAWLGEIVGDSYEIDNDIGNLHTRDATQMEKESVGVTSGTWSLVHTNKTVHFVETEVEGSDLLEAFKDEFADEIKEIACCVIPFEKWPASSSSIFRKDWIQRLRSQLPPYKVPRPPLDRPPLPFPVDH
jgi:hypothetical protein